MDYQIYDWSKAFSAWQDMPEVTLVGVLPDAVAEQVKLPTTERRVFIHRKTVEHVRERRGLKSDQTKLVLQGLGSAVTTPEYAGCNIESDGRTSVICVKTIMADTDPVVVAVKFVPAIRATTAQDELLVSTGYTVRVRRLRAFIGRYKLHNVTGS